MIRFVVDDAPWAPRDVDVTALESGLDALADRIQVARSRREEISLFDGFWNVHLVGDDTVVDLLYDVRNGRGINRDVRTRLQRQLDQIAGTTFNETELEDVDVEILGSKHVSPASAYAHRKISAGQCVACITPSCSSRKGPLAVAVKGVEREVNFVESERRHVEFFRSAICVERADEDEFAALAPSAFPELEFVENVWRGLRNLSRPYRDRRDDLIRSFGVLSDEGARIFALGRHALIEQGFSEYGLEISPENAETLNDPGCRRARERRWGPDLLVFSWHVKIERHIDRIHVHQGTPASNHRVIIGIIADHLPLPGGR